MVVKFVNEVTEGQAASQEMPRILYSGTTGRYLGERLSKNERFTHAMGQPVYLTTVDTTALSVAWQRAKFYGDVPVVLVVDTDKLAGELRYDNGSYKTMGLNVGSFVLNRVALDADGYIGGLACEKLAIADMQLQNANQNEAEQELKRSLSGL